MAHALKIDAFIQQLWDGELGYLNDLVTQELRRRAVLQGDGVARDRHIPLSTAYVLELGAE
jgi:hypothetical protein